MSHNPPTLLPKFDLSGRSQSSWPTPLCTGKARGESNLPRVAQHTSDRAGIWSQAQAFPCLHGMSFPAGGAFPVPGPSVSFLYSICGPLSLTLAGTGVWALLRPSSAPASCSCYLCTNTDWEGHSAGLELCGLIASSEIRFLARVLGMQE